MLTREQILEIDQYCVDHKMTQVSYLEEHGIPRHQYYRWKKKYREEDEQCQGPEAGTFLQLTRGGSFMSPMIPPARTSGKKKRTTNEMAATYLSIELRTVSGTAMRIQGNMTADHLRAILSGNV